MTPAATPGRTRSLPPRNVPYGSGVSTGWPPAHHHQGECRCPPPATLAASRPISRYQGLIQPSANPRRAARRTSPKPSQAGRMKLRRKKRPNSPAPQAPAGQPSPLPGGAGRQDQKPGEHEREGGIEDGAWQQVTVEVHGAQGDDATDEGQLGRKGPAGPDPDGGQGEEQGGKAFDDGIARHRRPALWALASPSRSQDSSGMRVRGWHPVRTPGRPTVATNGLPDGDPLAAPFWNWPTAPARALAATRGAPGASLRVLSQAGTAGLPAAPHRNWRTETGTSRLL